MTQISVNDYQKLHQALILKFARIATKEIIGGFIAFAAGGVFIGWLFGSAFYGAVFGLAIHALLVIVSNDAIEAMIKDSAEEAANLFKNKVANSPNVIQNKYLDCIKNYDADQMKVWARRNFRIVIRPEELIKIYND